jgi:hypothetical protein
VRYRHDHDRADGRADALVGDRADDGVVEPAVAAQDE